MVKLPFGARGGLFFATDDPSKLLAAGDVQAEVGDTLAKWVSHDGSVTLDAVGSPVLVSRPWCKHPLVQFDGSSGFGVDDSSLVAVDDSRTGSAVMAARTTRAVGSTVPVIMGLFPDNSDAVNIIFGHRMLDAGIGSGLAVYNEGSSSSIETYCSEDRAFRTNSFSKAIWSQDGSGHSLRTSFGKQTLNNPSAKWFDQLFPGSFDRHRFAIGYRFSQTASNFFEGEIAYAGLFSQYSESDLDRIEAALDAEFETRAVSLIGDSRLNTDGAVQRLEELLPGWNVNELATGGNSIADATAPFVSRYKTNSEVATDVVILAGVNNFLQGGTVASALADLGTLLGEASSALPSANIHVIDELPSLANSSVTAEIQAQLTEYHDGLPAVVNHHERASVVRLWDLAQDPDATTGTMRSTYTSDGLHPNNDGYTALYPALAAALIGGVTPNMDSRLEDRRRSRLS